ncbi:MAG TPA: VWA domain-containing protein [Candidatus Hodarchaeales archaeon]|nr:VWA domain-containing protein [Candidatus Hodarchaeales archaeon]
MNHPNIPSRKTLGSWVTAFLVLQFILGGVFPTFVRAQKKDSQFSLKVPVELVIVPVTVEDKDGNLIGGLSKEDFELFVEEIPQEIIYFSSDPVPLSVAVLIDKSMDSMALSSIKNTLISLVESFSPFDEIALLQFENTTEKVQDFTSDKEEVLRAFKKLSFAGASNTGFGGGPFSGSGGELSGETTINGVVIDTAKGKAPPPKTLNTHIHDAIFNAATELRRRKKDRRGVIVIISNGQNAPGNRVSFDDAMEVVIHSEIQVYGIGQGSSLFYRKLNTLRKYANASGGSVFFPVKSESLAEAYQKIAQTARNKYVLGFTPRESVKEPTFRKLSVRIRNKEAKADNLRFRKGFYVIPK